MISPIQNDNTNGDKQTLSGNPLQFTVLDSSISQALNTMVLQGHAQASINGMNITHGLAVNQVRDNFIYTPQWQCSLLKERQV